MNANPLNKYVKRYGNWTVYLVEERHTLWFLGKLVIRNCKTSLLYYNLTLLRFVTTVPRSRYSKLHLFDWFRRVLNAGLYKFLDRLFPKPARPLWKYRSYSRSAWSTLAVQSLSLQRGGNGSCDRWGWSPQVEDGRSGFVHRAGVWRWKFFHDAGICAFAIRFFDVDRGSAKIWYLMKN